MPSPKETKLTVKSITIISCNTDDIYLHVDLPSGIWPFEGDAFCKMEVAKGTGREYVDQHLPGVPVEEISTILGLRKETD